VWVGAVEYGVLLIKMISFIITNNISIALVTSREVL